MLHVVPRRTAAEKRRTEVVRILDEALTEAKSGEIDSALLILQRPDGTWRHAATPTDNFAETIGRVEIAKLDWIDGFRMQLADDCQ